jgi:hypothetical protein
MHQDAEHVVAAAEVDHRHLFTGQQARSKPQCLGASDHRPQQRRLVGAVWVAFGGDGGDAYPGLHVGHGGIYPLGHGGVDGRPVE